MTTLREFADSLTTCPVCGHACRVVGSDEGTNYYAPVHLEGTITEERLARAIDEAWPKHYEGSASYPASPTDTSYLVDDIYGAKPNAAEILALLATPVTPEGGER